MFDRVVHQNCYDGMAASQKWSVDLIFADPPFNIGFNYDTIDDRMPISDYLDWSRSWMVQTMRLLKPNGTLWLAIGDEFAAELKIEATKLGFHLRNWVVWEYSFGVHCARKFGRSKTHLLYFVKDPGDFTFNADAIRVESLRQVAGDKRANPLGRVPGDVWKFNRIAGSHKERIKGFPCQMPEAILSRIIKACSNPGDLVLDPFAGSGSTLAVAKKLGRRFLGFEISEAYCRRIEERLARCS